MEQNANKGSGRLVYDKDTIYIIGDAQASVNNPITQQYNAFFIGLVVDTSSHKIVDAGCSSTIPLTSEFVRSIFIGHNMLLLDVVAEEIRQRYHGSSQKALIVAYKDAQKKYKLALNGREELGFQSSGTV
ncbi:DUF3870 domain-containing protein [Paenibacillus sp. 5J-6]|uniref:DUF3870 domain-containing protein n=1 Tax=Paenibacillus silvestris TaxID=2606219 RepID=A0A6L8VBA9_9BACL|nr:DUF3870 domain-containing protein [Paenibacillus silvestris]MZQ86619.1 DUF3870 domain-containing protein [Paenibacillus silvestris]